MNYYDEVNSYVKKVEIGKAIRETNANMELVECYWNVGKPREEKINLSMEMSC